MALFMRVLHRHKAAGRYLPHLSIACLKLHDAVEPIRSLGRLAGGSTPGELRLEQKAAISSLQSAQLARALSGAMKPPHRPQASRTHVVACRPHKIGTALQQRNGQEHD